MTTNDAAVPAPAREPRYLEGLNPEQREAVLAIDGPVLVLAGAGTGKTRVLTTRLAHILASRRAWPGQILAVTFTNKAAREMKERIGALIGGVVEGMQWLGTFHSIAARMLRRHAELAGLKSNFTILDADDQVRLMKQIINAEGIDEKRWPARTLAGMIDGWKNRGPAARGRAGRRRTRLCQRQGQDTLCRLSAAAEGTERGRFRRSAAGDADASCAAIPTSFRTIASASNSCWSTNIRTPMSSSICG